MINRLSYFISSSTNPYLNLAVEEYLFWKPLSPIS